jgi:hypothetical protein
MRAQDMEKFKKKLDTFLADIVIHLGRKERQYYGGPGYRVFLSDA